MASGSYVSFGNYVCVHRGVLCSIWLDISPHSGLILFLPLLDESINTCFPIIMVHRSYILRYVEVWGSIDTHAAWLVLLWNHSFRTPIVAYFSVFPQPWIPNSQFKQKFASLKSKLSGELGELHRRIDKIEARHLLSYQFPTPAFQGIENCPSSGLSSKHPLIWHID